MSQTYSLPQPKRRISPALALAVLSPVIAEVLAGSTHLSILFALVPEILVWGCGALLIREVVRRLGLSGTAMLLMGFVLSLAEEFLIQQTSLAPLPWLKAPIYGRAFGVNWIFLLFMLVYESVWVVLVPVQLVELIYPERRSQPWLRRRGIIITGILFLIGCRIAWYAWIKRARPMVFHAPPYHPSPYAFLAGICAIVVLIAMALNLRAPQKSPGTTVPSSMALFLVALVLGLPWYALLTLQFTKNPAITALPFWIPMLAGVAWGAMAFILLQRWSSAAAWDDIHRYASVFAAMLVCTLGGWLAASSWLRIDKIAQVIFDLAAIGLMIALGMKMNKHTSEHL